MSPKQDSESLTERILQALPQTQCTRCGYEDCAAYANAIAQGQARINQCPPGGNEGILRLSALTGQTAEPLNPEHGQESPRHVAWIDEDWCIGCTLCIEVCPVDAIFGATKRMHTVIEADCTGCELCLPVCPVDCIHWENTTGAQTGWSAWSPAQAERAQQQYLQRQTRRQNREVQRQKNHLQALETKSVNLAEHSLIQDPERLEQKKSVVEMALARARAKTQTPRT